MIEAAPELSALLDAPAPTSRCSSRAASCCASRARSSTRCRRSPSPRPSRSSASARSSSRREDDRRALRAPRQPAARGRARRRPHEGAHARADPRAALAAPRSAQGRPRRRPPPADAPRDDRVVATTCSSDDEQQLFARLSVFAGGCTLEAAEEVCDADLDTLQSLVEKSLLRFTDERYWMLETIREYAAERLDGVGRRRTASAAARPVLPRARAVSRDDLRVDRDPRTTAA